MAIQFAHLFLALAQIMLVQGQCAPATFRDIYLFGGRIININTTMHSNFSTFVPDGQNHFAKNISGVDACEVLITYTHPGYNDTINTVIWLPSPSQWSGRFLGAGGGGWSTGVDDMSTLAWAASEGFAVASTDSGHGMLDPDYWALTSVGNLNWALVQDFASTCLDEAATLGKAAVKAFYGKKEKWSYFNGCSQGGRQGHLLAQRFPSQYNGILATAPALYWGELMMEFFWAQAVMNDLHAYPAPCEFEAIQYAAVKACDGVDGLEDGIVLSPNCTFDPSTLVGQTLPCTSTDGSAVISSAAATVARAVWTGARSPSGRFLWHGLDISANLTFHARTSCSSNSTCISDPIPLTVHWQKYFLALDPSVDLSTVNTTSFYSLFHQSVNRYSSVISAADPDLTLFAQAGGKMISWHGTSDMLLGPKYTENYVRNVQQFDANASSYYRYFEAPGLDHCGTGTKGFYPGETLQDLIKWVEEGVETETLVARNRENGRELGLCVWPKRVVYLGGDAGVAKSYGCE